MFIRCSDSMKLQCNCYSTALLYTVTATAPNGLAHRSLQRPLSSEGPGMRSSAAQMRVLRRGAAFLGLVLGTTVPFDPVLSDSQSSHGSWRSNVRWIFGLNDPEDHATVPEGAASGLRQSPGRVLAWGASFGKSPQQITAFGDRIVRVAASEGLVAAITDHGHLYGLVSHNGAGRAHKLEIKGTATCVAIRSSAREVTVLDSKGRVHTVRVDGEGSFQPAKLLHGALSGANVSRLRCGTNHCVAITKNGEAISWGESNSHGQLGRENDSRRGEQDAELPGRVKLPDGVRIEEAACGDRHTIFLDRQGALYATGDDRWAQLGIVAEPWLKDHAKTALSVRKSELLTDLAGCNIAGGGQHSVMLVKDGTVFSFGFNQWGQLGHHNYSSLAPPSPIADYTIRALTVSAGKNHTCLVRDSGEMLCIGANDHGQLGNGTLQPSMTWKKVRHDKKPIKPSYIHASGHTCAVVVAEKNEASERC